MARFVGHVTYWRQGRWRHDLVVDVEFDAPETISTREAIRRLRTAAIEEGQRQAARIDRALEETHDRD